MICNTGPIRSVPSCILEPMQAEEHRTKFNKYPVDFGKEVHVSLTRKKEKEKE